MLMPGRRLSDHVDGGHDQQKNTAVATFCDALSKCACSLDESLNKCGQAATVASTNQKTLETFLLRCAFWDNFIILFLIPQHS